MSEHVKYKEHSIAIIRDEHPEDPRTEWENFGTMVCFHRRYKLGDEKHGFGDADELLDHLKALGDKVIALPLYLYDHSGITMNTTGFSCPWDSGQVGIIFITKAKVRKEYGWKLITRSRVEKIKEYLRGEVQVYDNVLTGSVYGYKICLPDGNDGDSCWGFYGDDHEKSGLLNEARGAVDCSVERINKEHTKKLKAQIKHGTPLEHRKAT